MTDLEAAKVIHALTVGFQTQFNAERQMFWTEELRPFNYQRATAAARETVRNHDRLTLRAFLSELDQIHEKTVNDAFSLPGAKCARCGGSGQVLLRQRLEDVRNPKGHRMVDMSYRCDCPAGAQHPKLRLAPAEPQPSSGDTYTPEVANYWLEKMREDL